MRHRPYLWATVAGVLTAVVSLLAPPNQPGQPFVVYVVGEGVPEDRPLQQESYKKGVTEQRPLSCKVSDEDAKDGYEIWAGAEVAWRNLAEWNGSPPLFDLRGKNPALNRDTKDYKEKLSKDSNFLVKEDAKELLRKPEVLAVIGYPSSSATQAAAQIYYQGGIPLIMPVATADTAVLANDKSLLTNCFRLPPSDSVGQAPAIANFINHQFASSKVHIVSDELIDHQGYSQNLCRSIASYLNHPPHPKYPDAIFGDVEKDPQNVKTRSENIANQINDDLDDLVIFCGYSGGKGAAKTFFEALLKTGKHWRSGSPPTLIFSDAAVGLRTQDPDFQKNASKFSAVYIADFHNGGPRANPHSCVEDEGMAAALTGGSGQAPPNTVVTGSGEVQPHEPRPEVIDLESAQRACSRATAGPALAYDAVLILQEAVKECSSDPKKGPISRECLQRELEHEPTFVGMRSPYAFQNGDNVFGDYFLLCFGSKCKTPTCRITTDEIVRTRMSQKTVLRGED